MAKQYTLQGHLQQKSYNGIGPLKARGRDIRGRMQLASLEFLIPPDLEDGDTIKLCHQPSALMVIGNWCRVVGADDIGGTLTVSIGTEEDESRWAKDIEVKAGEETFFSGGTDPLDITPLQESEWIIATVTSASGLESGKRVLFQIMTINP